MLIFSLFYLFINNTTYLQLLITLNSWLYNFFILSIIFLWVAKFSKHFNSIFAFFLVLSQTAFNIKTTTDNILILVFPLWVGTLNIHPILFYLTIIMLFIKLSYLKRWFINQTLTLDLLALLFLSLSALILGGVWGLQSLSWGYFWVNDSIEWVLFLICLSITKNIHTVTLKFKVIYQALTIIYLLTLLLLIRLNLVPTRHNFFISDDKVFVLLMSIFPIITFFINLFLKNNKLLRPTSLFNIYICCFYLLNSKVIITAWLTKFSFVYNFYFFCNKISYFLGNLRIYAVHAALILSFFFWSHIFTFFFVDYRFMSFKQTLIFIYKKVIVYTAMSYAISGLTNIILEFVDFMIAYSIGFLTQMAVDLLMKLTFNLFYVLILMFILIFITILKGLNLDFYIKKKHIFKNRVKTKFTFCNHNRQFTQLIYTVKTCRIDLVSIRLFKKCLRRKFIKAKTRFFKPKYWILMMPNFLLTQKSKNSRMGAGVGKFVRLTSLIHSGKSLIKTWYYTYTYLRYLILYMHFKIPHRFLIRNVTNKKKI